MLGVVGGGYWFLLVLGGVGGFLVSRLCLAMWGLLWVILFLRVKIRWYPVVWRRL